MFLRSLAATRSIPRAVSALPAISSTSRHFFSSPFPANKFQDYLKTLKETVKEVNVAYVDQQLTKDPVNGPSSTFHLIDVRETSEWNDGHIPYAIYTGRGNLERDIEHLVPDTFDEIVLYCAGGNRSLLAADSLKRMGYKNVASMAGGIGDWKNSGKKIESSFNTFSDLMEAHEAPRPVFALSTSAAAPSSLPSPDLENLLPTPPSLSGRESPANVEDIQNVLMRGTRMLKYPNKASSRPEERVIKVDLFPLQMSWESKKKKSSQSTADIHAIREIRLGQNTKAFEMHGKVPGIDDRAFTVIYVASGKYKMLNLVAPTKEYCEKWVTGLHMLLAQADGGPFQTNMRAWLQRMWKEADTHGKDRLDLDEVTSLMRRLNIRLSKLEIKSTFKQADISKQGFITFYNFERLYKALRFRPEIAELFSSLAKEHAPFLTYDEFEMFITDIQKNVWTKARCIEVYKKYCPSDSEFMDLEHFSAFLISANNAIFRKSHTEVYQDMTRPINEYFINSSHNTYLLGDQLTSESSVEGYIRALQRGCRCLELDCFDGPNGPLIYHKHSLTGRILFRDAIEAISRYAFVSSPYPLFLSLELHCSTEQQNMMVAIMQELFGDHLLTRPLFEKETTLPSPEALKHKIVLKAKIKLPGISDELEYETEEEDLETPVDSTLQSLAFDQMLSISESKALPALSKHREEWIQHTLNHLSRVYPGPIRLNSSNFDPITFWDCGVQMVAMNFQTFDRGLQINRALFAANGRSGYVLRDPSTWKSIGDMSNGGEQAGSNEVIPGSEKTEVDLEKAGIGSRNPNGHYTLSVLLISAHQLPKAKEENDGTVMDPVVEIEVASPDAEVQRYRTKPISGSGDVQVLNIKHTSELFEVALSLLVMILTPPCSNRFQVTDGDSKLTTEVVGTYTIALTNLELGYRHIPLLNRRGEVIRFSTLFVRLNIE
ncbi:hypothetical protein HDU97_003355 [Phlyctochytrium planicorne]|nr:hypothetical protein HDU97_003355 [Phlyctochytrium planicorne]